VGAVAVLALAPERGWQAARLFAAVVALGLLLFAVNLWRTVSPAPD